MTSAQDSHSSRERGGLPAARKPAAALENWAAASSESSAALRKVKLSDVDRADERFQLRLHSDVRDLERSLIAHGQQVPVTLWGSRPPYKIIDGFRRIEVLDRMGEKTVLAVVRRDLDEHAAFALSFIENARRRNFSALDKAHAIWIALNKRQMTKDVAAQELGLSRRQLNRYLRLLNLGEPLEAAVVAGRLSMAHAAELRKPGVTGVPALIDKVVDENLSVEELKRLLRRKAGRPRPYVVRAGRGFRTYPFRYHPSLDQKEKKRILAALQQAIEIVRETT